MIADSPSTETEVVSLKSKRGNELLLTVFDSQLQIIKSRRRAGPLIIPMSNVLGLNLPLKAIPCLVVHYVKTISKKWTHSLIEFHHSDLGILSSVKNNILSHMRVSDRPKKLLFFVNPFGGKGKAEGIFKKSVKPLLEIAEIQYEMELTTHKDHALDSILSREDLESEFDGVVSVGGDGMFSEVFNGVLRRSTNRPGIRVGIIPAGSTDALALSLHGTRDVLTCILHILLGDKRNIDVTAIHTENAGVHEFERYSLAMASYGYFGDLLCRSENYRWMGPRRYDYAGFKALLANQSYQGNISFLGKEENHYSESVTCSTSCRICECTPYVESGSDQIVPHQLHGTFMAITAATLTCACEKTPNGISPYSHLGDGFSDLILVDKCSRLQYINYLLRTGYKRTANPFKLSYVRTFKVKEMTFSPSSYCNNVSVWNCDGELISNPQIRLVVHCQFLPVFARGILPSSSKLKKKLRVFPWIFKRGQRDQEESSLVTS